MKSQNKFPNISIKSSIPLGCGGGSSASIIVATISALCNYLNLHLSNDDQYKIALLCENLQHGKSSGGDITTIINKAPVLAINNQFQIANFIIPNFTIVNTGIPLSSTGEAVAHVSRFFDKKLIQEFSWVTSNIVQALKDNNLLKVKEYIKHNHALLTKIGVVPQKVQRFISKIETQGGSAKISGAGSVEGDNAGLVIIFGLERKLLEAINKEFNYKILS
jgi:mevalonate kinase